MLNNLKLAPKFTLLLSLVFIGAIFISGGILAKATEHKAESDVVSQGQILITMVNSVRNYTDTQVNPLVALKQETSPKFIPQAIPSYAAREVFELIRQDKKYKDFLYKDAVINPTNIRDQADNFEIKIVDRFRKEPQLKEVSGFRNLFGKQVFYSTYPIIITNSSCLRCHSTPAAAPKSQIATYGSENGFGWELNKVLGVQTLYIPSEEVFSRSRQYLGLAMAIFIGIFAVVILLINFLLKQAVIQPIRPMARLAQKISNENFDQTTEADIESLEKAAKNSDELGQLARLFQQMVHTVSVREQTFAQQLQQLRAKSEQVKTKTQSANTEIAYFKALQQKAQTIRNKSKGID